MDFSDTIDDYEDQIIDLLGNVVGEIVDRIIDNSEELTDLQVIELTEQVYKKVNG